CASWTSTATDEAATRSGADMTGLAGPRSGRRYPRPGRWHDSLRAPATDDAEVVMTRTRVPPVLVTGATGRVGRAVVDLLIDAGVPVRALTHRSEAAATLPATLALVAADLTAPQSPSPPPR